MVRMRTHHNRRDSAVAVGDGTAGDAALILEQQEQSGQNSALGHSLTGLEALLFHSVARTTLRVTYQASGWVPFLVQRTTTRASLLEWL